MGLGLAIGAGYFLGRTKKLKLALAVGSFVAGKKMNLTPKGIGDLVSQQLKENPQFKEIGDQLRNDLRGVGKAASGALVERQIEALADRLHGRTAEVRDQLEGVVPGKDADDEADEEYDEPQDTAEDEDAEDTAEDTAEDDEAEDAAEDDEAEDAAEDDEAEDTAEDDEEDDEEEAPPRKTAARKAPAKKAPAKKSAKKAPAKKAPARKAPARTSAAKKTASAGKPGTRTAAKTASGTASRSRRPKGGGDR
ncbi:cobalamin biosynthesis protein CobT [Streptomyces achromogenes]|uniref:Cobalamin biosynthesis protein CobT n=2 Tax=Streptomyces achromogenes TaxID=67255 RepID=A0ABU0QCA4_STRAH|nr:cobalamin biosynthesis protein CobT [Streptomyces achromogenes]